MSKYIMDKCYQVQTNLDPILSDISSLTKSLTEVFLLRSITSMHDITGEDLDSWKESTVYVNWKVTDDESGLDYCEWAIGN